MKLAIIILAALSFAELHAGVRSGNSEAGPDLRSSSPGSVELSGLQNQGRYAKLPPVMVILAPESRSQTIWVEARRHSEEGGSRPFRVKQQVREVAGGRKVLNLHNLAEVCRQEGNWSLRVMSGRGLNVRTLQEVRFVVSNRKDLGGTQPVAGEGLPVGPQL